MASDHRAPWRSAELTAYFEGLMDSYAQHGDRHLVFTPPTTRGSLITRAEAWIISVQRQYMPTLDDAGRWPTIYAGEHPDTMHREQQDWLSRPGNWGAGARLWVEAGCPTVERPVSFKAARAEKKSAEYRDLVMHTYDDFAHQDKRKILDKKTAVERAARNRL